MERNKRKKVRVEKEGEWREWSKRKNVHVRKDKIGKGGDGEGSREAWIEMRKKGKEGKEGRKKRKEKIRKEKKRKEEMKVANKER